MSKRQIKFFGGADCVKEFRSLLNKKYKLKVSKVVTNTDKYGIDRSFFVAVVSDKVLEVLNEVEWRTNAWNLRLTHNVGYEVE